MIREPEHPSTRQRILSVVGPILAMVFVAGAIVLIFTLNNNTASTTINNQATRIQQLQTLNQRLEIAYSKLRDQDATLNIAPAAPSLGEVITGSSKTAPIPLPKSFTAAFPTGRFTCTDKTGEGNYNCTVEITSPTPSTSTTTR